MAEKKFYWLKLDRNFFKRHDIKIIEAMPNGKDYVLFYMKLLLESIDHEGELRFSDTIPYNESMLATITDTNIDIVRSAIKMFKELDMMQIYDDGTLYMSEINKMIGCETSVAERVRKHRQNQKLLQCNADETNCNTEKEKDIELEIEIEKEYTPYGEIANLFNKICIYLSKVQTVPDSRKKKIRSRYKELKSINAFEALFHKVEESDFLTGKRTEWKCTFDWLMENDKNYLKVMEGQYDNKKQGEAESTERKKEETAKKKAQIEKELEEQFEKERQERLKNAGKNHNEYNIEKVGGIFGKI
jgi:predicted phage replisome organizer